MTTPDVVLDLSRRSPLIQEIVQPSDNSLPEKGRTTSPTIHGNATDGQDDTERHKPVAIAKVRVAGSNPVVRSKETLTRHGLRGSVMCPGSGGYLLGMPLL